MFIVARRTGGAVVAGWPKITGWQRQMNRAMPEVWRGKTLMLA